MTEGPASSEKPMRTRRRRRQLVRAGLVAVLAALGIATVAHAQQTHGVVVEDNVFEPETIEITEGDTVRWTQEGENPHTITADDGSFDSSPGCPPNFAECLMQGDTYEQTFTEAGEVPYYCKVHGGPGGEGMSGVIVVQQAAEPDPAPQPTAEPAPEPEETAAPASAEEEPVEVDPAVEGAEEDPLPQTGAPARGVRAAGFALIVLALLGGRALHRARGTE